MATQPLNIDVLASPDDHAPLGVAPDGAALVTGKGEAYPIRDGILYLLPRDVQRAELKEREREGWKKVFEANQWRVDGPAILELPDAGTDQYWKKCAAAFRFAEAIVGVAPGKCGLDLACGVGWATARFARRGARMIAADFNDTVHNGLGAAIQTRALGVAFDAVCCDGERLPIADASLDFAFICSALHHFTDPGKTLAEIHRVLKPGGVLIDICESFRTGFSDAQREEEHEQLVEFRGAGINEQSLTQAEYAALFAGAGFRLTTLLPDWDAVVEGAPPEAYMGRGLRDAARTHRRAIMRLLLGPLAFGPVVALLRWRRLKFTVCDRIFVARKRG